MKFPTREGGRSIAWFLTWTFSDGNFQLTGYPPINQKGKYRILKNDGDKLTLKFNEQSGTFGTKNKVIEIIVDKEKKTLEIDGRAGFRRIKEKASYARFAEDIKEGSLNALFINASGSNE